MNVRHSKTGAASAFVLPSAAVLLDRTAPGLLVEHARQRPYAVACRAKRCGIYVERSWHALAVQVSKLSQALQSLGFVHGDRLAIMGDACEEWMIADLACQALGGITYGIYPTASASEVEYQLRDGGAALFVAEDQEYVDRVLSVADRVDSLKRIIVIDSTALFMLEDPRILRLDRLVPQPATHADRSATHAVDQATALASNHASNHAAEGLADDAAIDWLEAQVTRIDPRDPAFIVYTSGTTGHPKGALVAHGAHLAGASNLIRHYPALARAGARTVVYLPLCHVLGRDIAVTLPLLGGPVPHYGESVEDLPATLFDVAPTVLFTVPRYLQKMASQVLTAIGNAAPFKRRVFEWALGVGRHHARDRWQACADEGPHPAARPRRRYRTRYGIASQIAFRPVLNKLGLDRAELVISGGAPLARETATFWQMLGVNLCEMYGQTETGGAIIAGQRGRFAEPGDVGTVAEGIELRLVPIDTNRADEGELHVRSRYLFDGYWNQPGENAALFPDGWLATGDVVRIDGKRIFLIDRARDFIVTAGGKTLSPSTIENEVRGSTYITEVVVFGHARRFVSALIEIDEDAVADWARGAGVVHAGFTALAEHPGVNELIQREIDRANASLARVEQIKRFTILPKALDPEEEGEPVTPTRKVKRGQMYERYAQLVEAMYASDEEALLERAIGG